MPELEVAQAVTVVLRGAVFAADDRRDALRGHRGLSFGEDARLRCSHARHVADGEDSRVRGLERQRVDRDPSVDGHARLGHDRGHAVHRHSEEQVVGHLASVGERGDVASGVEPAHESFGVPVDAPLLERDEQRLRGRG